MKADPGASCVNAMGGEREWKKELAIASGGRGGREGVAPMSAFDVLRPSLSSSLWASSLVPSLSLSPGLDGRAGHLSTQKRGEKEREKGLA